MGLWRFVMAGLKKTKPTRHQIRPHIKWVVSLVIAYGRLWSVSRVCVGMYGFTHTNDPDGYDTGYQKIACIKPGSWTSDATWITVERLMFLSIKVGELSTSHVRKVLILRVSYPAFSFYLRMQALHFTTFKEPCTIKLSRKSSILQYPKRPFSILWPR